jgi:chromosome segregation ATPase
MLHAAYQRMGSDEKKQVDALLEAEYAKLKDNSDLTDRLAFYARTEPGERDNELHSVIGTEVGDISPALETHYAQYFTNRQAIVALHTKYDSVFVGLQTQSSALSTQLSSLGATIQRDSASYNTGVAQLNQDITDFNRRAAANDFTSRSDFESTRSALVARANDLNTLRNTINGNVAQYNSLRDQLSQLSVQSDALNRSIDSSLAPAPSI